VSLIDDSGDPEPNRVGAVEGCEGIGRHIATRLSTHGEQVVDVARKLSARARVFVTGQGRKTDATDAHSVALVGTRMTGLRPLVNDEQLAVPRTRCRSASARAGVSSRCVTSRSASATRSRKCGAAIATLRMPVCRRWSTVGENGRRSAVLVLRHGVEDRAGRSTLRVRKVGLPRHHPLRWHVPPSTRSNASTRMASGRSGISTGTPRRHPRTCGLTVQHRGTPVESGDCARLSG
jgi:hypothetical protein